MGHTHHDPTDHFRTTNPHAGEQFIDPYSWPGVVSIVLGVLSVIACVTTAAYMRSEWTLTLGVTGGFAIIGGVAWLVIEHHRVLRIERVWKSEHSDT